MREIIDSWSKVSIGQYEEMCRLHDAHPEDNAKYIVEMLYDIEDAYNIPLQEFTAMAAGLRAFSARPISEAKLTPAASYTVNGKVYNVDISPQNFTAGQYVDLDNYIKAGAPLSDMLSAVIIPEGHLYNDGYDMAAVKADINNLPVTAGFAVLNFFGKWSAASTKTFLRCLTNRMKKGKKIAPEQMEKLEKEMKKLQQAVTEFCRTL